MRNCEARMEGWFTWQMLMTYSGATLATTLITEFLKGIGPIARLPTRLVSYIIALTLTVVSTVASEGFVWSDIAMAVINAVVVALAANGAFDAVAKRSR